MIFNVAGYFLPGLMFPGSNPGAEEILNQNNNIIVIQIIIFF